jgi:hypothetical protein
MDELVEYFEMLIKRAKEGSLKGVVVYGVVEHNGATFSVVGKVGLDDFSILSVRAAMAAMNDLRMMEEVDAIARRGQPLSM